MSDWTTQFNEVSKTIPLPGSTLTGFGGAKLRIHCDCQEGKEPFLFAVAYVPEIVGTKLGWVCVDSARKTGLKLIVSKPDRARLIREQGLQRFYVVSSVTVKFIATGGKCLIVSVQE